MIQIPARIKRLVSHTFLRNLGRVMFREEDVEMVHDFFCNYGDFRILSACSKETGLDIEHCREIRDYLYKERRLGGYYFEKGVPPHKYMRQHILKKFPWVSPTSFILEVGPEEHPLFPSSEYSNWYAIDKYYDAGVIDFRGSNGLRINTPKQGFFMVDGKI
jgi:hypothetical protein